MTIDHDLRSALGTFVAESRELLQEMEAALLELEQGGGSAETIHSIFRAAHTIKGSAGLFGLTHLVRFTHTLESVLDALRDGKLEVTPALIGLLLPCCDHLGSLVESVAAGADGAAPELAARSDALLAKLDTFLEAAPQAGAGAPAAVQAPAEPAQRRWRLSLRFAPDCLRNGMDPLSFVGYLGTMGTIVDLATTAEAMPALAEMDPETCYLAFEIVLESGATREALDGVFDFVREGSDIRIEPEDGNASGCDGAPADGPGAGASDAGAAPAVPAPAAEAVRPAREAKAREAQSVRVDAARLDRLIDLVGELVIAGSGAALRTARTGNGAAIEATAEVLRLVEQVRDSSLQLRMVPIGTTFGRFQRVVRDVSTELGKAIDLVITGGETEVDKSVVEKIGDPLMHLVRNAMDHGIEPVEARVRSGKPARGTLRLNAFHDSGTIVIEVADDGAGIDRDRVLAKAVERGLVAAGATLSEQETFGLIFEPGFSTAAQVSSLSGRGVGMDVVKRNISELRGSIEIDSAPGCGTTMRLRLPLTLAIIDGFHVAVGGSDFVVPLDRVVECVALPDDSRARDYMDLRNEVLPFIRLRSFFELGGAPQGRENVVVVEHGGAKAGLVVDRLLGGLQTVIKPLGRLFSQVEGIGGSTILGSGEVALILDVPGLVGRASRAHREPAGLHRQPVDE